MFSNRVVQLVFRSAFLVLSIFGTINSIILFCGGKFNSIFYLYFTNLSNYLCLVVMLLVFIRSFKYLNKGELYGHNDILHRLKFISTVAIFVTGSVYCFVLYPIEDYPTYFLSITNITFHTLCPLLFVLDYILFDAHFKIKVGDIFLSTLFPLIYATTILILGAIIPNFKYPYFFLDVNTIGYGMVFLWIFILFCVFVPFAFLFYLWDKTYFNKDKKFRVDLKHVHKVYEYIEE